MSINSKVSFRIPIVLYVLSFHTPLHPFVSCRFVLFLRFIVSFRLVSMNGKKNAGLIPRDECLNFINENDQVHYS